MRASWLGLYLFVGIAAFGAPKALPPASDPRLLSVHPFTAQRGTSFTAVVRGNSLNGVSAVFSEKAPFTAAIENTSQEPPDPGSRIKTPTDLVRIRFEIAPDAKPGRHFFRLVTANGISNSLPLHITEETVVNEPEAPHETPEAALRIEKLPAIYSGRIAHRGESDYYSFEVKAGDTYTFEAISGLPSVGAPGGNANGFDPSISLYEPSGSWFDPKRVNRIAFNDEPLWVLGQLTDAHLTYKFAQAGRYYVRVEAFSGQGGPDYGYQLKIASGETPPERMTEGKGWNERSFTRTLSSNRLNELAARAGRKQDAKSIETYGDTPEVKLPATIEGGVASPGETHRTKFHLDGPQDIALEIETPQAPPPVFNPVVRLVNAKGDEVATNIFAGKGACTGALTKAISAKTIVPIRDAGDYTVEIRDTTSDLADPTFRYRVQIRPQVPHIGSVKIDDDHINLSPGDARTVRVTFDREEDYRDAIAVEAESLPPGVKALIGADYEPDKDPPMYPGKRERYVPRTERTVVVFTAAPDAPATSQPQIVRLVVRPIAGGKPGPVILTRQIPLMVVVKK